MAPWLLGWCAGLALQWQQPALWPAPVYGAALAVGVLWAAWRCWARWAGRRSAVPRPVAQVVLAPVLATALSLFLAFVAAALLGFASTGLRALHHQADVLAPPLEERPLWLHGTVADLPQDHPDGLTVVVAVLSAELEGQPVQTPHRVRLFWPAAPANVSAGQVWRWPVRLRAPHGLANPHGFDRELWLWEQGVGATGVVRTGRSVPAPVALGQSTAHFVDRWRGALTDAVRARVDDARSAGIIAALLVGHQSAITRDDWQVFRDTGVAHLMAISGLHITLFAWLATRVIGWLWRRLVPVWPALLLRWPTPLAASMGGLVVAALYAVLAGWGVPAQRTVFMLACVVLLRARGLDWPWPQVWLACLALVLLLDPWAGLQAGFWLSFVAVMLLFASGPRILAAAPTPSQGVQPAWWPLRCVQRMWLPLRGLVREQALMTLALAPLTLLLFGQVSVVGLLANLVAIPWVTLLVTPLVLLGVLFSPLWDLAALALQGMVAVLSPLARWPLAVWFAPAPPWPLAALGVGGALLAAAQLPPLWRLLGMMLVWPALAFVPARPAPGTFELYVPDVGQGSAVLVRTTHHSLLFDAGARYRSGGDVGERVLVPWLRRLGEQLDVVVVSHRDSDHAGGAETVLRAHPQAAYLASYASAATSPADGRPSPVPGQGLCQAGQAWTWDGVLFEVQHPTAADHASGTLSSNALSCVLRVSGGERSAWLTGDVGRDQEVLLAARHPGQRADVLMAPHHGSRSSSSPVWLNELMPRWVLIQAGHLNRFGHPAPEVLARYEARGARWLATPACGEMRWRSAQPDEMDCHRDTTRRYWHWRSPVERTVASSIQQQVLPGRDPYGPELVPDTQPLNRAVPAADAAVLEMGEDRP